MADGQLEVELVPDEELLESVEEKQLEVSGEADSVQEAKQLNEEQNQKMGIIARSLFQLVKGFGVIIGILTALLATLTGVTSIFDLSFEDLRTAIVSAINSLKQSVVDFITPDRSVDAVPSNAFEAGVFGAGQGINPGFGGPLLLNALNNFRENNNVGRENQNQPLAVFTSRDQLLGDSTFQEKSSDRNEFFLSQSGSGGNAQQ